MDDRAVAKPHRLRFRFVTEDRWLLGHVSSIHRRLIDVLNAEPNQPMLVAEGVTVQNDYFPTREDDSRAFATVNLSRVLLVIPQDDEPPASAPDPYAWVPKRAELVRVGIGPYEVVGNAHLPEGTDLKEGIAEAKTRFVTLTNAMVRRINGPNYMEQERVVLVNKERLDFIMPGPAAPMFEFDETQGLLD